MAYSITPTPDVLHVGSKVGILTDHFVWCGQRVRIRLTPAHWEDVHRFHVNNELWGRSLQTCSEKSRWQGKTGFTNQDPEEEREMQSIPATEC